MDFARQQRDPTRHLVGLTFVVLLHVVIIWGLMNGLGRKVVEVIKKPLEAKIIEEIKLPPPPPPPPPKPIPQARPLPAPEPQPYVPPPDIPVPVAVTQAPTITAVTEAPPTQPHVIAPPPPPAPVVVAPPAPPPPPPPPPKPAIRKIALEGRLSGDLPVYPRDAIRANIAKGKVVVRVQVDEKGNVIDLQILVSEPPRVFDRAVRNAIQDWKFKAEGEKYTGDIEVNFTLKDE